MKIAIKQICIQDGAVFAACDTSCGPALVRLCEASAAPFAALLDQVCELFGLPVVYGASADAKPASDDERLAELAAEASRIRAKMAEALVSRDPSPLQ